MTLKPLRKPARNAAAAEQERCTIWQRTKAALTKAKARGIKSAGAKQANANRAAALAYAERLRSLVTPLAGEPLRAVVKHLDDSGILTPRGGRWQPTTVKRLLDRLGPR